VVSTIPFLLNEDAAIKARLQGITVSDTNAPSGGREVKVRFRSPEDEVAKYFPPLILMEMPSLEMAWERMHSGWLPQLPYYPEGYDASNPLVKPPAAFYPVAYNINYQFTVYTRIVHHLMTIMAALESENYIGRFAFLPIPQDGTYRYMTRLGGPERDYSKDELGKRLFRATYQVQVSTELVSIPPQLPLATSILTDIYVSNKTNIDYSEYYNPEDLTNAQLMKSWGIIGTRAPQQYNTL
jgi:hypothetical protein